MLTETQYNELFYLLADNTPVEGEWNWPLEVLMASPVLADFASTTRRDKVVEFRKKLLAQTEGDRIRRTTSRHYQWVTI